ncbi:RNA-binding (RRM/RBD/RNP motifs) family protein [Striga asiatica]|uniref:RNA-binding (RRM/RBD/RNP motifs) family protein n=1 Tax=Striga asiatica TaxID=4170 RepID=A0A5A7PRN4_STRAF|nr:RNA-binding (RRM/RBD/RNP motifs) family protein [Striga asiatica]
MENLLVTTVKVSNLSLGASERDVKEFFSFSGDIEYVEMRSDTERSQIAFVTFKDAQGAETAVLLSASSKKPESAIQKAEDVVSSMLAKGFILGKDAVNRAKSLDERHGLTSTASAKVSSLDKKIGLTEKISIGTSIVNDKVREVDSRLHVTEKARSALAAAELAGSAIMKNRYVLTGTTWVAGALSKVSQAAGEVGQRTKEKVVVAEDEQRRKMVDDFAQVHLSESPKGSDSDESKPAPVQGLVL